MERDLAHARSYLVRASQDTEDGEHALEMTYESGTLMNCYARQACQLREGYERYAGPGLPEGRLGIGSGDSAGPKLPQGRRCPRSMAPSPRAK